MEQVLEASGGTGGEGGLRVSSPKNSLIEGSGKKGTGNHCGGGESLKEPVRSSLKNPKKSQPDCS